MRLVIVKMEGTCHQKSNVKTLQNVLIIIMGTRRKRQLDEPSQSEESDSSADDHLIKKKRLTKKRETTGSAAKDVESSALMHLLQQLCKKVDKTERALKDIQQDVNQTKFR